MNNPNYKIVCCHDTDGVFKNCMFRNCAQIALTKIKDKKEIVQLKTCRLLECQDHKCFYRKELDHIPTLPIYYVRDEDGSI